MSTKGQEKKVGILVEYNFEEPEVRWCGSWHFISKHSLYVSVHSLVCWLLLAQLTTVSTVSVTNSIQLQKYQQTTIFCLRTGHCRLRSHLHCFNMPPTNKCPCGFGIQTPDTWQDWCCARTYPADLLKPLSTDLARGRGSERKVTGLPL